MIMLGDSLGQDRFMEQAIANQRAMFDQQSQLGMQSLGGRQYSSAHARAMSEVAMSEIRARNRTVTIREELQRDTDEWLKDVI